MGRIDRRAIEEPGSITKGEITTGLFDLIFKNKAKKELRQYFQMLNGYTPVFSSYDGGVYEMELTRACIHTFASHCSKLQPNVEGADLRGLKRVLDTKPNPVMTGTQFLYKTATIFEAQNTVFIVPLLDRYDQVTGFYPVNPLMVEFMEADGEVYIRYTFADGSKAAVELSRVGIVSKFLYTNDIIGDDNSVLKPTMQLLYTQNKGIEEGIKNSATFRFMALMENFGKEEEVAKYRKRFVKENMGPESGGLALFPTTFKDVKQIQSTAKIVDTEQMDAIQKRVYNYFGANEDVLQNKTIGDSWSAYYEGKIEPFALQLSQAMTVMSYSKEELARNNAIMWSANRLQYMTNPHKLQVSTQLFDRGVLSTNDVMDIWNLPHVPDGDARYIRKEYTEVSKLDREPQEPTKGEGNDHT